MAAVIQAKTFADRATRSNGTAYLPGFDIVGQPSKGAPETVKALRVRFNHYLKDWQSKAERGCFKSVTHLQKYKAMEIPHGIDENAILIPPTEWIESMKVDKPQWAQPIPGPTVAWQTFANALRASGFPSLDPAIIVCGSYMKKPPSGPIEDMPRPPRNSRVRPVIQQPEPAQPAAEDEDGDETESISDSEAESVGDPELEYWKKYIAENSLVETPMLRIEPLNQGDDNSQQIIEQQLAREQVTTSQPRNPDTEPEYLQVEENAAEGERVQGHAGLELLKPSQEPYFLFHHGDGDWTGAV